MLENESLLAEVELSSPPPQPPTKSNTDVTKNTVDPFISIILIYKSSSKN
ncbi:hypothetical protein VCR4J5_160009 [Vibrio crassostreae]|uniref:Uncharacterized protein n=1 Tax=Vibrio crassostreae TaxID=246167 RepID=A0ABP1WR98_9VIBR|nr:hypothetical protein VCR4J5_160009 [Vibrio crassostreae]